MIFLSEIFSLEEQRNPTGRIQEPKHKHKLLGTFQIQNCFHPRKFAPCPPQIRHFRLLTTTSKPINSSKTSPIQTPPFQTTSTSNPHLQPIPTPPNPNSSRAIQTFRIASELSQKSPVPLKKLPSYTFQNWVIQLHSFCLLTKIERFILIRPLSL
jgi:cell division septation protein DedD